MTEELITIVAAGAMFGLYALPCRYIKGYSYENIWFIFFCITFVVLPAVVALTFVDDLLSTLQLIPMDALYAVVAASFLWGAGIQFWSKAIDSIGIMLSFSIFISSVLLFSSIILYIIDGFPPTEAIYITILGFSATLVGVLISSRTRLFNPSDEFLRGSALWGILCSLLGGLLTTSIFLAYKIGLDSFESAKTATNNPVAIMLCTSYFSGALYAVPYFAIKLFRNNTWQNFRHHRGRNIAMITIMSLLFFLSVAAFAYDAYRISAL